MKRGGPRWLKTKQHFEKMRVAPAVKHLQMVQMRNDCGRLRNVLEKEYRKFLVGVDLSFAVMMTELLVP